MKWIAIARRRLASPGDHASDQQKEDQPGLQQVEIPETSRKAESDPANEKRIMELDQRSRTLVNIVTLVLGFLFLWAIWAPVLPALKLAEAHPFWTYMTEVEGGNNRFPSPWPIWSQPHHCRAHGRCSPEPARGPGTPVPQPPVAGARSTLCR